MVELPPDSRTARHLSETETEFDTTQHLLAHIIDLLSGVSFDASVTASGTVGKQYGKIARKKPKGIPRPEDPRKVKRRKMSRKFLTGRQLVEMSKGRLAREKRSIKHTEECVQSKVNEGGGKLNCACPVS